MSRLGVFAGYLVFVVVGGGLLAPWLWWGAQALAGSGAGDGLLAGLAAHPFHRYVHRCLLLLAVIGCWPLARCLGIRSLGELGLELKGRVALRRQARDASAGLVVALAMFAVVLVTELGFGIRAWRDGGRDLAAGVSVLARAGLSGIAVGVLEEVLFRGILCGGLRRGVGWIPAIVVSSAVYAAVHLFQRPAPPESMTFWSGLQVVADMLGGLASLAEWWPEGATLFGAGVLLAGWYRGTGRLAGAMGLHLGWVVATKMRAFLTVPAMRGVEGVTGGASDGWVLLVVTVATLAILGRRAGSPEGGWMTTDPNLTSQ